MGASPRGRSPRTAQDPDGDIRWGAGRRLNFVRQPIVLQAGATGQNLNTLVTQSAQIVEDIGGGVPEGRTLKAVLVGGPSGGCVPASLADTPVDYEALKSVGAIMGSGGLVVLDDTDCMVDIARYFLRFTQDQSCGKCTFCRVGTKRMLEIMDRICGGKGRRAS